MMRRKKNGHRTGRSSVALLVIALGLLMVQAAVGGVEAKAGEPAETKELKERRLGWWREARFGLFVHWGPVSLKGT